jgi:hypothetical protein
MSRIGLFVAGIVVGIAVTTGVAQNRTEMYMNHVGIAVPNAARLANATDFNGVRIELAELTPESLQRKAIDSWK